MSAIKDRFQIVVQRFAGVVKDQDIPKLIFKDSEGKEYRFTGYEDKTILSVVDDLVSCEWEKAEDAAQSIISQSGEPRGPAPAPPKPAPKPFAAATETSSEEKSEEKED